MLTQVAEGVLVHESAFVQSNAVVVRGRDGALVVDPGITVAELDCLADDLEQRGDPVVAGFSTHPDWDHVLWHPRLGPAPRWATARGADTMRDLLADPGTLARVAEHLPPEIHGQVPLDLFGLLTGLPVGATELPWDGPRVRVLEHRGHAAGHAALLVEDRRVLVAGDMLSDVFVPMLDVEVADPVGDYLAGLRLLEDVAGDVDVVVPGHGSVCRGEEVRARIELDRAYVLALRDGRDPDDPRIGPSAQAGWEWVVGIHEWQAEQLARRDLPGSGSGHEPAPAGSR
ncbi:MBL fold metallo-hydrolase [Cellulomonas sp. NS3]|uniref:MBL fold metallo-hydrolase n=1 Tax=Cellulomonas sp. NS3 TaxID=2973977 RepID=UPI0021625FF9|nr:MBL fold metallo-hydrolase [Cellulomonas sp. NS3]